MWGRVILAPVLCLFVKPGRWVMLTIPGVGVGRVKIEVLLESGEPRHRLVFDMPKAVEINVGEPNARNHRRKPVA